MYVRGRGAKAPDDGSPISKIVFGIVSRADTLENVDSRAGDEGESHGWLMGQDGQGISDFWKERGKRRLVEGQKDHDEAY